MPAVPVAQLTTLRSQHPHCAKVQWYLALCPYGSSCFTAQVNDAAITRGAMTIAYDGDVGEDNVSPGMTLWVGSPGEVGSYDIGRVRIRSIDTVANAIEVAENSEIPWADDQELCCPGAYGFRELWGKYPRMTEVGGTVDFFVDYDDDFTDPQDTVLPPKANAGPPAVAWVDPGTGLASVSFTGDRSYSPEIGAAIAHYAWQFPGAVATGAPPAAGNLVLWLDANTITGLAAGDPVALWEDQSGLGNDVAQGVAANRPTYWPNIINGNPAVWFDGINDYLSRAAPVLAQLDNWTIVVVMQPTGLGVAGRLAFYIGNNISGYGVCSSGNAAGHIGALYNAVAWLDTTSSYVDNEPCAIEATRNVNMIMYRDTVPLDPVFPQVPVMPAATTFVGWDGVHNFHSGYIAEILVFNTDLNAAQREQLSLYLGTKYNLTVAGAGTCAAPITVNWDTPGFRYVSLTVTDDTAQARTGTVYVPVWIFDEGTEDPFKLAEISSQDGDTANGWRLALKAFQTNTAAEDVIYDWPDGALVVLFTRTWFGSAAEGGVGGWCMADDCDCHYRDNIRFVGWLLGETLKHDFAAGTVEFEAVAHDGIMRLIPGWPFTIEDIDGVPTDWYEVADLNVDRALHYLLEFYSTVNQVCHVERVGEGNTRPVKIQSFSGDNLYDQAQGDLLGDAKCLLLSDRQGILYATQDPQFLNAAGRGGVAVACHLQQNNPNGQADWLNEIDESKPHRPVAGMVRVGGFAFDTPLLARAPGAAPVQQANEERVDGLIFVDQTEANLWAGLTLTQANLDYPQIPLELVGYWPVFDPAYQEYVQLTVTDPTGRRDWTAQKFIVRQVSFDDRVKDGTSITSLVLEKASDILTGETVTVPETPSPESPSRPTPPAPPPPWGGDLTHAILMTTQGILATETLNEDSPIWYASNASLADRTALHDMSFDYNHGSRLFTVGALGAWVCQDIWNTAAWAMPFANADAPAMINAVGGPCTPLTWDGAWSCVNCEPTSGYLEFIAGCHEAGAVGCNYHKRAFYSGDSLVTCTVGDDLDHDAACGGPGMHPSTPWAGQVSSSGGHSLYTYVCGWAFGSDQHRGLCTDGGVSVNTCGFGGGQIGAWAARPVYHARAGATVFYYVEAQNFLFYSTDHGSTWAAMGAVLPHLVPILGWVAKQTLCVHNLNTSNLVYCGGINLQYSTDGGTTWGNTTTNVASSVCAVPAMVAGYPEGQAFVVGCSATPWIHLTCDFGASWQDKTGNLNTWLGLGDSIYQIILVQG